MYLQSVRLEIPARVVMGTLGTSPFMLDCGTCDEQKQKQKNITKTSKMLSLNINKLVKTINEIGNPGDEGASDGHTWYFPGHVGLTVLPVATKLFKKT